MEKRKSFKKRERGVAAIELSGIFIILTIVSVSIFDLGDSVKMQGFEKVAYLITGGTKGGN